MCIIGLGLDRSLEAGLRIPDEPRTFTGLGADKGDETEDDELAGLMGIVDGA